MDKQKKMLLLYYIILFLLSLWFIYSLIKLFPIYKVALLFVGKLILPFLIAAFLSYLIHPLLVKIVQYNIHKNIAILMLFFSFAAGLFFLFYKSVPIFIHELQELSEQLPQLIHLYEEMIYSLYESTSFLPETVHDKMDTFISQLEGKLEKKITHVLEHIMGLSNYVVFIAIIPVLVFYFLKDYPLIKQWTQDLLPQKFHHRFNRILKAIDDSLGDYVRGQLIISSVIIGITYLVYHLIGLKYALLLAIIMGIMNIIPYFGPIIGTIPAVAIALTMSMKIVVIVIITNSAVQLLESSFLSPYVMGKSVQIHPIILIFTLLIGAEMGGVFGMIIAVPAVTIMRAVFLQYRLERRHSR